MTTTYTYPHIDLAKVRPSKKTQAEKKQAALKEELVQKNARWEAKQTPHSYLTLVQKKALLGVVPDKALRQELKAAGAAPMALFPPAVAGVDWRTKEGGKVSPIKDQGACGSCVSFGVVGLMESMALIEHNTLADLSEADLHFCSSHGAGCNGWFPSLAIQSIKSRGVCDEARFPYISAFTNGQPGCITAPDRAQHLYKITSSSWYIFNAMRKEYLTNHGPLVACMDVYDDFFNYGGGVYHHVSGRKVGGHCILVVGFSDAEQCWICKNSWNITWGEQGFFKIAYGECKIDGLLSPFFGVKGINLPA
jgi:C1A family cysteine protease